MAKEKSTDMRNRLVSTLCVVLFAAVAPTTAQETPWATTMTVGVFGDGAFRGYNESPAYGALDDSTFTVGAVSYSVSTVSYAPIGMLFTVSASFPHAGWTLTLGDQVLHLDDAERRNEELPDIPGYSFFWRAGTFEQDAFDLWSEGQRISVGLSRARTVPVLPVPALAVLFAILCAAAGRSALRRNGRP